MSLQGVLKILSFGHVPLFKVANSRIQKCLKSIVIYNLKVLLETSHTEIIRTYTTTYFSINSQLDERFHDCQFQFE